MESPWPLVLPVLMALVAVGAVLSIKVARRRQATRTGTLKGPVPAKPLSAADARRMGRNYALVAVLIVALTLVATALIAVNP
jgi:hypothetical protein